MHMIFNQSRLLPICKMLVVCVPLTLFSYIGHAQTEGKKKKGGGGKIENSQYSPLQDINIIPGAPDRASIRLNIISPKAGIAQVDYTTDLAAFRNVSQSFSLQAGEPIEIRINNLQPGTRYYYRLRYTLEGSNKEWITLPSSFNTQPAPGKTFVFGVQGDSHPERAGKMFNSDLYFQTIDSVISRKPDFYFMMGDDFSLDRLINAGKLDEGAVESIYRIQRKYWGNMGKNLPLFLVNGNHEQAARYMLNGSKDNFAVYAANARKKYFSLPDTSGIYTGNPTPVEHIGLLKDYYAFEWGDALFVVIDPYWHSQIAVDNVPGDDKKDKKKQPWDITLGNEQYAWLKSTLENSKAKFKFVFAHHVSGTGRGGIERASYFEWGGYNQQHEWEFSKYRPQWELPIHQLMVKNKVSIFFQGHDHLFAHQEMDGLVYQSVPNPADDTYTAFNAQAYLSGTILPNAGFIQIRVSPENVQVEYVQVKLPGSSLDKPLNYKYNIPAKK